MTILITLSFFSIQNSICFHLHAANALPHGLLFIKLVIPFQQKQERQVGMSTLIQKFSKIERQVRNLDSIELMRRISFKEPRHSFQHPISPA